MYLFPHLYVEAMVAYSCKAVVRDDKIFHVKYLEVCEVHCSIDFIIKLQRKFERIIERFSLLIFLFQQMTIPGYTCHKFV